MESDTRFSTSVFFHESVYPGPLSIPLGSFRLFSKIRRDNLEWMFISGVNDTGDKRWHRRQINLCHGFSLIGGVVDTGDKFIIGVVDTAEK